MTEFSHTPAFRDKAFLQQKYLVEGRSMAQIAKEISSSKEAVRSGLSQFGIPVRQAHRPHGHPSQSKYGSRVAGGKSVAHLGEQRVVRAVQDLKREGLTLRQIAAFLTKIGVPTKQRGKRWHPQMISRLLGKTGANDLSANGLNREDHRIVAESKKER